MTKVANNNERGKTPRTRRLTISALIHTVSASEFKAMSADERTEFLANVGSEFLAKTGRGKNIKTVFAMPESYGVLFGRRLRQAAKLAEVEADAMHATVLDRAKAIAAGNAEEAPKPKAERKPAAAKAPKAEVAETPDAAESAA